VNRKIIITIVAAAAVITGYFYWDYQRNAIYHNPDFAYGNGRLEATEVYISSKINEKIAGINVTDGDYVKKGQVLAAMQKDVINAQLAQAEAKLQQARSAEMSAKANIRLKESELEVSRAEIANRKSALEGNLKRFKRAKELLTSKAISRQNYENDETLYLTAKAEFDGALASLHKSEAAVAVAKAELEGEKANIKAAEADVIRIKADLKDCDLTAPLDGRVQYRIAQPGEVISAGGRVLNMVDLSDVYMNFYLPEKDAGKVALGTPVRLLLDALPDFPIPAEVSYVASVAQFTPKTVETKIERQKLMFRIKARIPAELLKDHLQYVKTGLPGVAWVKLNPAAEWPEFLKLHRERVQK